MDASRAAAGLSQQQMQADEAVQQAGQAGASPEQVHSRLSGHHHASMALFCITPAGEWWFLTDVLVVGSHIFSVMNAMYDASSHVFMCVR